MIQAMPQPKKHLCNEALLRRVRRKFDGVNETPRGPQGRQSQISLSDCLMSALAVFQLKFPSLLQFDNQRSDEVLQHNLRTLYGVEQAPCDTYLRERLDGIDPQKLRRAFTSVFAVLQRGKVLESYTFLDGHYLLSIDGTGFFSSHDVHCENCCEKHHKNGTVTYYHHMLCAVVVHPDHKHVFPLCPEPILKQDGATKNDCERNAAERLLADFRREHPHLRALVVEDALAANGPHLRTLKAHDVRFLITVKPGGNKTLFEWLEGIELETHRDQTADGDSHHFRFFNGVPLNDSHPDLEVNFLAYEHFDARGHLRYRSSWITDLTITADNALQLARGARARWRIENETFNTLKNQGYGFEHNYGHGRKNLSTVMAYMMMLAFLIDQAQETACLLFQTALTKGKSRIALWHKMRAFFEHYYIATWSDMFQAIAYGHKGTALVPDTS